MTLSGLAAFGPPDFQQGNRAETTPPIYRRPSSSIHAALAFRKGVICTHWSLEKQDLSLNASVHRTSPPRETTISRQRVILYEIYTDYRTTTSLFPAGRSPPTSFGRSTRIGVPATTFARRMIYLRDNPLLKEPLRPEHFKIRLLGHWGSDPGRNIYMGSPESRHSEIRFGHDLYLRARPWRSRPVISNCYLEGTYSEIYPEKSQDEAGMLKLFRAFSFPGQIGKPLHTGGSRFNS